MQKFLTIRKIYRFLTVLSVLFTVGDLSIKMTTWTMNNVLCNPVFTWLLCSILLTILVFVVDPFYNRFGWTNKKIKAFSYLIILGLGCLVIFTLPKGERAINGNGVAKVD